MRVTPRLLDYALFFSLASGAVGLTGDTTPPVVPEDVRLPLLGGDWSSVANAIGSAQPRRSSPVARLIEGHACLALNRNNDAFDLFRSAGSEEDLEMWLRFAEELQRRESANTVALYLLGDAHARKGEWEPALDAFARALAIQPEHPLVLNARGVVHVMLKDWDRALLDLGAALRARPDFADVHASLGALWIERSTGAKGARSAFTKALEISPCFALALYGRAAVEAVLGRWEPARLDLWRLAECLPTDAQSLVTQVEQGLDRMLGGKLAPLVSSREEAGMQMDRYVEEFQRGDWGLFGANLTRATELAYKHPELRPAFQRGVQSALRSHPEQKLAIAAKFERIENSWAARAEWHQGLSQSTSFTGRVTGQLGLPAARVGGELGITRTMERSLTSQAQTFREMRDYARTVQQATLPRTKAGGFKTGLEEAAWDQGCWPFTAQYGLGYVTGRDRTQADTVQEGPCAPRVQRSEGRGPGSSAAPACGEGKGGG